MNYLLVFLGGGIGSLLRYSVSLIIKHELPVATLLSNVLSTGILSIVLFWGMQKINFTEQSRLFWVVGVCGGFSTFSTFSYETFSLLQKGEWLFALLNVVFNLIVCLAFLFSIYHFTK